MRSVGVACFLLMFAAPALAQRANETGSPYVLSDTTRILPRWLEGQIQLGFGWMGSPGHERSRYEAGIGAALAAEARPHQRLAVRGRVSYLDLPPDTFAPIFEGLTPVLVSFISQHGSLFTGAIEMATPIPASFWLFAGAGGVRYGSNALSESFVVRDSDLIPIEDTGWGTLWSTGVQYRFQLNPRDHFILEARSESASLSDRFRFWGLSVGYRFP